MIPVQEKPLVRTKLLQGKVYWVIYLYGFPQESYNSWPDAFENALTIHQRFNSGLGRCIDA